LKEKKNNEHFPSTRTVTARPKGKKKRVSKKKKGKFPPVEMAGKR